MCFPFMLLKLGTFIKFLYFRVCVSDKSQNCLNSIVFGINWSICV